MAVLLSAPALGLNSIIHLFPSKNLPFSEIDHHASALVLCPPSAYDKPLALVLMLLSNLVVFSFHGTSLFVIFNWLSVSSLQKLTSYGLFVLSITHSAE